MAFCIDLRSSYFSKLSTFLVRHEILDVTHTGNGASDDRKTPVHSTNDGTSTAGECWLFEDNLQYLLLRDYLILLKHVN